MSEVKEIRISGFRGIKAGLHLSFVKGKSIRPMVIYGRNGTGKSSITDAWEWLQTEQIEHLRREGAGKSSYPHKNASDGETFIEVDFNNDEIGSVKLEYDFSRITKPISTGNIDEFRALAPHPCFIRFEDLTRFVFLTKTEKFDALARLMGFMPQVELQKSLKRVSRELKDNVQNSSIRLQSIEGEIKDILELKEIREDAFLVAVNKLLTAHKISKANLISELGQKKLELNNLVVNDPRAKALAQFKIIQSISNKPQVIEDVFEKTQTFLAEVSDFIEVEQEFSKLLLLELYEHGEKVVSQEDETGKALFKVYTEAGELVDVCPLCGQVFEGDLKNHIANELGGLRKLKDTRNSLETEQKNILQMLPEKGLFSLKFDSLGDEIEEYNKKISLGKIQIVAENVEESIKDVKAFFEQQIEDITDSSIKKGLADLQKTIDNKKIFEDHRKQLLENIGNLILELSQDNDAREKLVEDNTNLGTAIKLWKNYKENRFIHKNIESTLVDFENIVNDYIQSSISNVQERFNIISNDVEKFFSILEQDTNGLDGATLKLLVDEDRAVELQINFHGEDIYPAYRYLSESQLNSFGLAVFLASAKFFNSKFRFIILDDIINSFDGYKRPRIIELLKKEFSEHQILIFTHDNVWSKRLFESFPLSIKKRFVRWEINHGPVDVEGFAPLEEIQQHIDNDQPVQAGSLMGPFLERQFQELGENFEILIKYNRLNEYSLDPLLDRFRLRAQDKLGKEHPLVEATKALYEETGFRNLCAHWKNPAIQLTREEMQAVVDKWIEVEKMTKCQNPECLQWLSYDSASSGFICACGETKLEK